MSRIQLDLPKKFPYATEVTVRASDLNYGNHLGHDSVLTLMQESRIRFYQSLGFKNELNFEGAVGQVIADAAIQYKSEAFLGDVLIIELGISDFNKYGFDIYYLIKNKITANEVARGKTGVVCFDYASRKIACMPNILKEKLQSF